MEHFKFTNTNITYLYDGSFDGLLTIVFDCYINKKMPINVASQNYYIPNIFDITEYVPTDFKKSERIFNGISKNISYDTLYNAYYAFLAEDSTKEINILKYLLYGFIIGPSIDTMLSIDFIFKVHALRKKMLAESHKLKGLLRFSNIGDNLFYSSIHPTNNVVENLGHHFIRRLPTQNFIIHDKGRNIAFVYNTHEYQILDASSLKVPDISEKEKLFQDLWKAFFKTIAIKERTNPKVQMQFMPKKYWQDLTEMKN